MVVALAHMVTNKVEATHGTFTLELWLGLGWGAAKNFLRMYGHPTEHFAYSMEGKGMRILIPAVFTVALAMTAGWSGAYAAEARITDFAFGCETPDGRKLKPKFGDVEGVFYTDIPAQREQCIEAIKNKIALCRENTDFASNTRNEKYAECLPIFREQAQTCVQHFEHERVKCDGGERESANAAGPAATAALAPKCNEEPWYGCWAEIVGRPGCHFRNTLYLWGGMGRSANAVWSGGCSGGMAEGHGTLSYSDDYMTIEATGTIKDGELHGHWVIGDLEGSYLDGDIHGPWLGTTTMPGFCENYDRGNYVGYSEC